MAEQNPTSLLMAAECSGHSFITGALSVAA